MPLERKCPGCKTVAKGEVHSPPDIRRPGTITWYCRCGRIVVPAESPEELDACRASAAQSRANAVLARLRLEGKLTHIQDVMTASEAKEMVRNILRLRGEDIEGRAFAVVVGWPLGDGPTVADDHVSKRQQRQQGEPEHGT